MGIQQERTDRIDALRGLIERLCAPALTLAEAKVLRGRISDLLEVDKGPAACDQLASSPALGGATAFRLVARDLDAGG